MDRTKVKELSCLVSKLLHDGRLEEAYAELAPVLAVRAPFTLLDIVGEAVGKCPQSSRDNFLDRVAIDKTMGGWVVLASALAQQWREEPARALERCRDYIMAADVWYATDIFGERVPGPALVRDFVPSLEHITPWRQSPNRWVRRTVGVSIHFWAKRSRGEEALIDNAATLLAFLEPMFTEPQPEAIKGVGWALKTLGRHYPVLLTGWLLRQLTAGRKPRSLMVRKAITYLSRDQRHEVMEAMSS